MRAIRIKGEEDMPSVILDRDNNEFELSGRSLPENAITFYRPILEWLDSYTINPLPRTEFVFRMTYYNTATAKQILEILLRLEDIYSAGHDVRATWLYESGDGDMEDAGVEYARIVNVPIIMTTLESTLEKPKSKKKDVIELKKNETFVVTISRELGTGGRVIGKLLSEKMHINYFDYAVIEALTNKYEDNRSEIVDNVSKKPWWKEIRSFLTSKGGKSKEQDETRALTDQQSEILKSIAQNESCIVAGQSAFYTFRDYPNHISIFICGSEESRISKLMSREGLSREDAVETINRVSRERDMFVVENTGMSRHDTRNYDLVINMEKISEEDAVDVIISYIAQRKKYFAILVDND